MLIEPIHQQYAADMADELERSHHLVALVPAPRQAFPRHRIRRAVEHLPEWYRRLMSARPSRRTDRRRHYQTAIKRRETIDGLRAIAAGRAGCYADLLLTEIYRLVAEDQAAEWATA